jgi:hypothetical protein
LAASPARATQRGQVQAGRAARVQADQVADDGVGLPLDLHPHIGFHRGLHIGHAGQGAQGVGQRQRGALEADEHIGEVALGVEGIARPR